MDINSVINVGHSPKQPLMWSPGELVDGLEPHDHIYLVPRVSSVDHGPAGVGRGVPGVQAGWVPGRVYRVVTQPSRLRLILGILRYIGSYGRLTEF